MQTPESKLVSLLLEYHAFRVGTFKLKSGATSPYFINFGLISDGAGVLRLGEIFAQTLVEKLGIDRFDLLIGPAYKGISLAVATAMALKIHHNVNKAYSYNRKEAKAHGADVGSVWVGGEIPAKSRLVILDDVFTTGDTKVEVFNSLRALPNPVDIVALLVGVDRQQHQKQGGEKLDTFCQQHRLQGMSVLNIQSLLSLLQQGQHLSAVDAKRIQLYIDEGVCS